MRQQVVPLFGEGEAPYTLPEPDEECAEMEDFVDHGGTPVGLDSEVVGQEARRPDCDKDGTGFSSAGFCAAPLTLPPSITGPKLYAHLEVDLTDRDPLESVGDQLGDNLSLPDIVYAPSDVDPAEAVPFREADFPVQSASKAGDLRDEGHPIRISSWNLAGTSEKKVKHLLSHVPCCDVLAVQEYPRQKCRWQILKGDTYHAVLFQDVLLYRAVGVFRSFFILNARSLLPKGYG